MMNETIKLLAGGISAIIPPEYIGQKLIESGTGILWKKLKKRLEGDNNAVGPVAVVRGGEGGEAAGRCGGGGGVESASGGVEKGDEGGKE